MALLRSVQNSFCIMPIILAKTSRIVVSGAAENDMMSIWAAEVPNAFRSL